MIRWSRLFWAVVALSPLVILYYYKHDTHQATKHNLRKELHIDFLHADSVSYWAKVTKHNKKTKVLSKSLDDKSHYIYEFWLKNRKYKGLVYDLELRERNLDITLNDSLRIVYSKSDPYLNVPHFIASESAID